MFSIFIYLRVGVGGLNSTNIILSLKKNNLKPDWSKNRALRDSTANLGAELIANGH